MEQLTETLKELQTGRRLFMQMFNIDAWSANDVVSLLSDTQRGWYIELRVAAWKTQGVLEDDADKLFKLAKANSREQWEKEKHGVLWFFDAAADADGVPVLVHRELRQEWLDAMGRYRAKVDAVAKARAKREELLKAEQESAAA